MAIALYEVIEISEVVLGAVSDALTEQETLALHQILTEVVYLHHLLLPGQAVSFQFQTWQD